MKRIIAFLIFTVTTAFVSFAQNNSNWMKVNVMLSEENSFSLKVGNHVMNQLKSELAEANALSNKTSGAYYLLVKSTAAPVSLDIMSSINVKAYQCNFYLVDILTETVLWQKSLQFKGEGKDEELAGMDAFKGQIFNADSLKLYMKDAEKRSLNIYENSFEQTLPRIEGGFDPQFVKEHINKLLDVPVACPACRDLVSGPVKRSFMEYMLTQCMEVEVELEEAINLKSKEESKKLYQALANSAVCGAQTETYKKPVEGLGIDATAIITSGKKQHFNVGELNGEEGLVKIEEYLQSVENVDEELMAQYSQFLSMEINRIIEEAAMAKEQSQQPLTPSNNSDVELSPAER